jgi:hypothetical protein
MIMFQVLGSVLSVLANNKVYLMDMGNKVRGVVPTVLLILDMHLLLQLLQP